VTAVPSSTFSSDIIIPQPAPRFSLIVGCLLAMVILTLVEFGLRHHGMEPQNMDSRELWASQRALASALGEDALVLVGTSRIQLGMDLDVLESTLRLTPVQLAIDGTSFLPVLEDLAKDPGISGTIIVSLLSGAVNKSEQQFQSSEWVDFYNKEYRGLFSPAVEKRIKVKMKGLANIYSSGIPLPRLLGMALGREPVPAKLYLVTDARRERDADYNLVQQPKFYLDRVRRHLGHEVVDLGGGPAQEVQIIRASIPSRSNKKLLPTDFAYINTLTQQLRQRGARVIFVRFPTSGLVWEIDQARAPKELNWDQFANYSLAPTIHFMDYPELQYQLADGSHLDKRQKQNFTRALAKIVQQKLREEDYLLDMEK
jgi:hypothetical protein